MPEVVCQPGTAIATIRGQVVWSRWGRAWVDGQIRSCKFQWGLGNQEMGELLPRGRCAIMGEKFSDPGMYCEECEYGD
jgi:hypothetical protein